MAENQQTTKKKADLKVVLVGSADVGKTCFITRYINDSFDANTANTIGASFFLKQWGPYNVAIWDTAGEERFAGLSTFYCRDAGAAIMAYQISDRHSFEELRSRFLSLLPESNCLKMVVGTKLDLVVSGEEKRAVHPQEARQFSVDINSELLSQSGNVSIPFFETSSKTGEGVAETFESIFEKCLSTLSDHYRIKKLRDSIQLHDEVSNDSPIPPKTETRPKKSCC